MNLFKSKRDKIPPVDYSTDPVRPFLFDASPKYREIMAARKPGYRLYSPPRKGLIRLTKSSRVGGRLPGLTPIRAEVRHADLEVIGVPGVESLVEAQSQADARNDSQAQRLLDEVKMEFHGSHIRLLNASYRKNRHCQTSFIIMCPKNRPVTVRGVYAAVRLAELTAEADIETTHARITILNVGPRVNARVEQGIIDYSGHQGPARLFAGWEINLNFTSQIYTGELEATAQGPVRVLIPQAFATSFEATVAKDAALLCRADITSQIGQREHAGRLIYTFGQERPAIRLTSIRGPIVIDNAPTKSEGAAAVTV